MSGLCSWTGKEFHKRGPAAAKYLKMATGTEKVLIYDHKGPEKALRLVRSRSIIPEPADPYC